MKKFSIIRQRHEKMNNQQLLLYRIYGRLGLLVTLFSILLAFNSCGKQTCSCVTITPPEITLTGPKTSVERQIMGNYKEIEKDAWLISSAKGQGTDSGGESQKDVAVFRSFAVLETVDQKLRDYQSKGILGENNQGYVEKLSKKLDANEEIVKDIESVLKKVNNARKLIYQSMLEDVREFQLSLDEVGAVFAERYQKQAPAGTMIQTPKGQWIKKK